MNLSFNDIVGVAYRLHIQLPTYSDTCQSIICGNAWDLKVNTLFYVHKLYPFQMPSSLNVPICFCLANCGTTKIKTPLFLDSAPCCCPLNASTFCDANTLLSRVVSRANRKHVVHGGERGHAGADGSDGHVGSRSPGCVSALWGRGQQCRLACRR